MLRGGTQEMSPLNLFMSPVAEDLAKLWALQRLDSELDTLRGKVSQIPAKIAGLNLNVTEQRQRLEAVRKLIKELKVKYRELELDVKETEEKIATKSGQLFSAKTNELYKAFIRELETLRASKDKIEDEMIQVMEELEKTEREEKQLEQTVAETEQETAERTKALEQDRVVHESELAKREAERTQIVAGLQPQMLRVYERIRVSKRGLGVVSITGGRCNGCLNPLPPQLVLEVSKKEKLYFCEHCGRLLVPEDLAC